MKLKMRKTIEDVVKNDPGVLQLIRAFKCYQRKARLTLNSIKDCLRSYHDINCELNDLEEILGVISILYPEDPKDL